MYSRQKIKRLKVGYFSVNTLQGWPQMLGIAHPVQKGRREDQNAWEEKKRNSDTLLYKHGEEQNK